MCVLATFPVTLSMTSKATLESGSHSLTMPEQFASPTSLIRHTPALGINESANKLTSLPSNWITVVSRKGIPFDYDISHLAL